MAGRRFVQGLLATAGVVALAACGVAQGRSAPSPTSASSPSTEATTTTTVAPGTTSVLTLPAATVPLPTTVAPTTTAAGAPAADPATSTAPLPGDQGEVAGPAGGATPASPSASPSSGTSGASGGASPGAGAKTGTPTPAGNIGRIAIPKLGIDMAMYEGIDMPTLNKGPGHWPGTASPGQPGNVVVAGHRVSHTAPFRYIDRLAPGDPVVFTVGSTSYTYLVTGSEIVSPTALWIVDQTPGPTATLFACHPPGSTAQRYVVHLKLA